jgi:DNA polymerase
LTDPKGELQSLADGIRARIEMERWFGVSWLTGKRPRSADRPKEEAAAARPVKPHGDLFAEPKRKPAEAQLNPERRRELLAELDKKTAACQGCPLAGSRTNVVFGEGNPDADVMFIGEAPGAEEDAQGRPFVGRAGKLLDRIIAAMGLGRREVYIGNVLKCRPPSNRNPTPDEVGCCREFLERQIDLIRPQIIVCLGGIAATSLLERGVPVGRLRGAVHNFRGTRLVVTYHPAYLLRNPSAKAKVWDDMKTVLREAGLPIPDHGKSRPRG